jgi:hypothetical protein
VALLLAAPKPKAKAGEMLSLSRAFSAGNPKIPSSKAQVNFKNPNLKSKIEPLRVS